MGISFDGVLILMRGAGVMNVRELGSRYGATAVARAWINASPFPDVLVPLCQ
jgi:hypothetical protein